MHARAATARAVRRRWERPPLTLRPLLRPAGTTRASAPRASRSCSRCRKTRWGGRVGTQRGARLGVLGSLRAALQRRITYRLPTALPILAWSGPWGSLSDTPEYVRVERRHALLQRALTRGSGSCNWSNAVSPRRKRRCRSATCARCQEGRGNGFGSAGFSRTALGALRAWGPSTLCLLLHDGPVTGMEGMCAICYQVHSHVCTSLVHAPRGRLLHDCAR
jgi:hypothetical protein